MSADKEVSTHFSNVLYVKSFFPKKPSNPIITLTKRSKSRLVRAFSFNETFGFQFGEVLFDGFGGDSDDFGEFSGRIVGVNFEQLEDFLPTFSSFLTTYSSFLTTI